ncbi:hypothetical protein BV25DRAFT_1900494 [Artomyces pyxidatus]|uniref:Uncharacterized protein n=1 Tax=Artomyces pyxidatus TaxID=48021 RepID=A0ACB8SYQ3_9AGAM|nr:hypothetical protein BV25DRAFT_1900494 [Artomyces pyxidatus]
MVAGWFAPWLHVALLAAYPPAREGVGVPEGAPGYLGTAATRQYARGYSRNGRGGELTVSGMEEVWASEDTFGAKHGATGSCNDGNSPLQPPTHSPTIKLKAKGVCRHRLGPDRITTQVIRHKGVVFWLWGMRDRKPVQLGSLLLQGFKAAGRCQARPSTTPFSHSTTTPMAQWADFETFMSFVNRVHFQEVRPTWHDKQWGWLSSAGLFIDDERKWESRWISGLTTVWYCKDVATGEEKVAKFVEHDSDEVKVLQRLSAMRDPAIKSAIFPHHIVDCGEAAMILMPRMETGALARWAHMGGAVTLRAVGDIAAGLSAFHRRGIAVADVDANNMIFEDSGGRGYVIDMGSAIMLPDNYRPGDLIDILTAVRLDNHPPEGLLGVDPLAFDAWGLGLFLCLVSTRVRWAYPEFSELDIFKAGALSELLGMIGRSKRTEVVVDWGGIPQQGTAAEGGLGGENLARLGGLGWVGSVGEYGGDIKAANHARLGKALWAVIHGRGSRDMGRPTRPASGTPNPPPPLDGAAADQANPPGLRRSGLAAGSLFLGNKRTGQEGGTLWRGPEDSAGTQALRASGGACMATGCIALPGFAGSGGLAPPVQAALGQRPRSEARLSRSGEEQAAWPVARATPKPELRGEYPGQCTLYRGEALQEVSRSARVRRWAGWRGRCHDGGSERGWRGGSRGRRSGGRRAAAAAGAGASDMGR